jgi:hypothetical protein
LARQLAQPERPKNIRMTLYSNPTSQAPDIAAVPIEKLMVDRMPAKVDAKQQDGPVMFEMDLQSSAPRKTPHLGQQ